MFIAYCCLQGENLTGPLGFRESILSSPLPWFLKQKRALSALELQNYKIVSFFLGQYINLYT